MADQVASAIPSVSTPQTAPKPPVPPESQKVAVSLPMEPVRWYFVIASIFTGLTLGIFATNFYNGMFLFSYLLAPPQNNLLSGDDLSQPKTGFNYLHKLNSFPEGLMSDPTKYQLLHFFGGHITSIPSDIGGFSSLTSFVMVNTSLTTVPEAFGNLTGLTELDLGGNKLTSLPDSLGGLTNLKTLYLYHNKFKEFPTAITQMTNLEILDLHGNQIQNIPDSIGSLAPNLKVLYLGGNKLPEDTKQKVKSLLPTTQIFF